MKRLTIKVSGKVQGVFYRATAREIAVQAGLTGIVRNEPDGSVYIEVEGEEGAVDDFVKWCNKGPARSQVQTIHVEAGELKGFVGFRIVR
ncbi:MAG: acylphosphatase [Cytophagales bacterium]|nr:acylphosphatase [Cytophagales bacterium]